jgi:hypothetical protein
MRHPGFSTLRHVLIENGAKGAYIPTKSAGTYAPPGLMGAAGSPHFLYSAKARFEYNAKVSALRDWVDPNGFHVSSRRLGDARQSLAEGLA